ncbi:KHG/KDPG aldolase [Glycine soja]|nr:KHG/KDPG aldolase [Glycine soja]
MLGSICAGSTTAGEGASYNGPRGELAKSLNLENISLSLIEDAKSAINAGAKFLMSPATVKDIMEMDYVQSGEILYIPGTMTPTEILSACDEGAKIVKIYPVSALGGFQYISALKKAFPHISMVASQGITIDSIGEYILRGALAVVLSDAIFDKDAIAQHDLDKIQKLAHSAALLGNKSVNR